MSGKQVLSNNAKSYLKGDITNVATSFDVSDGDRFPSGNFYVTIDNEVMLVTDVTDDTFTVIRGTNNVAHLDGALVAATLTAVGLQRHLQDNVPMFDNQPCCNSNRLATTEDANGNQLSLASFSWENQGVATAGEYACGGFWMISPPYSSNSLRMLLRSATPPFKVTSAMRWGCGADTATTLSTGDHVGICFRESGTSKVTAIILRGNANCVTTKYTDSTTWDSYYNYISWRWNGVIWLQLEATATTLYYRRSIDGINFIEQLSTDIDDWFTTGPDQIGLVLNNRGNHSMTQGIWLSWIEE